MSTWNATSKILSMAIMSTAVIPMDLLILEVPSTPPRRDFSSSNRFRGLKGVYFSIFWLSQTVPIRLRTPASCDRTQLPSRVVHDFGRAILFRLARPLVLINLAASVIDLVFFLDPLFLIHITSLNTFPILSSQWLVCTAISLQLFVLLSN